MLLADMPTPEDVASGQPISGQAWELTERMLAAIGFDNEQAYVASLSCFLTPERACPALTSTHARISTTPHRACETEAPSASGGHDLPGAARQAAHGRTRSCSQNRRVRTVPTFHPRFLLDRPSNKALAWRDLLLLMEEEV